MDLGSTLVQHSVAMYDKKIGGEFNLLIFVAYQTNIKYTYLKLPSLNLLNYFLFTGLNA